jgi:hypothetical protein
MDATPFICLTVPKHRAKILHENSLDIAQLFGLPFRGAARQEKQEAYSKGKAGLDCCLKTSNNKRAEGKGLFFS